MQQDRAVYLFTDGACLQNPGPGGWGFVFLNPQENVLERGGFSASTTNNKMEIQAVLEGILLLIEKLGGDGELRIYTDSKYLVQAITQWIFSWERNAWRTSEGKEVLNQELWQDLSLNLKILKRTRSVSFHHVPSHVGLVLNERADKIASICAEKQKTYTYEGAFKDYPHKEALNNLEQKIEEARKIKGSLSKRKSKQAYSYVSLVAGEIQTHKTWKECEKRVMGAKGARFKKSLSKEDEVAIIQSWS